MKTYEFSVTGMHCKSCAMLIESDLSEAAGIHSVKADADGRTVRIETDRDTDAKTLARELTLIVAKNGYSLDPA